MPPYLSDRREVSIMRIQHWQDVASLLLGVGLILSMLESKDYRQLFASGALDLTSAPLD